MDIIRLNWVEFWMVLAVPRLKRWRFMMTNEKLQFGFHSFKWPIAKWVICHLPGRWTCQIWNLKFSEELLIKMRWFANGCTSRVSNGYHCIRGREGHLHGLVAGSGSDRLPLFQSTPSYFHINADSLSGCHPNQLTARHQHQHQTQPKRLSAFYH